MMLSLALPVSNRTETFTYQLVYLNRAPVITVQEYNITTDEDGASDPYVNNDTTYDVNVYITYSVTVSAIVMALGAVDPEGTELGVAVIFVYSNNNIGYWQVIKNQFYS